MLMYEFGDFSEPIDAVCEQAFSRVRELAAGTGDLTGFDDSAVEHIDTVEARALGDLAIHTSLENFACGFANIHDDMLRHTEVPEYFNDIIAGMVRAIVHEREQSEGNDDLTLLMPAKEALSEYVSKRWEDNEMNRWLCNSFWVYKFKHNGNKGSVDFVYDETSKTWKLGYTIRTNRILLRWGRNIHEESADGTVALDPIVTVGETDTGS